MASGRKTMIRASEAVDHIRSGMSDTALMSIYSVSAKGLESLFRKLVAAELIGAEELERRMLASTLSHVVDLDSYTPPLQQKATVRINTSEAVGLIHTGMSDVAIMERFNISTRGLESLFAKLIAAGKISQADLDARNPPAEAADVALIGVEEVSPEPASHTGLGQQEKTWAFATAFLSHKMLTGAALGFLAGVLLSISAYFLIPGIGNLRDKAPDIDTGGPSAGVRISLLEQEAEHLIRILESITREGPHEARAEGTSTRSDFEACLRNCESRQPVQDEVDRVLLFNCKKACIVEFSDRMKKLRQTYYGSTPE